MAERPAGAPYRPRELEERLRASRRTRDTFARAAVLAVAWGFVLSLAVSILLLLGCASSADTIGKAADAGQKALAAVDVAATKSAEVHRTGAAAAVAFCRDQYPDGATKERREACLSAVGFSPDQVRAFEAALAEVGAIYDELAELLERLEEVAPQLEAGIRSAEALR